MRGTNISTRDALAALMMECYPSLLGSAGPSLNARISARLDDTMDAYADPPMLLTRPGTLAEVQRLVRAEGEKQRFCLSVAFQVVRFL
jgi:hypothetical protein